MYKALVISLLLAGLFIGGGYYLINHQQKILPIPLQQGNVCEPDSLVCSDGTVLKREGPNCEFPPCPVMPPAASTAIQEGKEVTIRGTIICLPHIDTSGPQTLECAFGIKTENGENYGLSDPSYKYLTSIGNGQKVEISGKLIEKSGSKYDSAGVVEIESLTSIK